MFLVSIQQCRRLKDELSCLVVGPGACRHPLKSVTRQGPSSQGEKIAFQGNGCMAIECFLANPIGVFQLKDDKWLFSGYDYAKGQRK